MNEDYSYFQDKEFRESFDAYERMLKTGEQADFDSETLTDIAEFYAMSHRMEDANRCIQYALAFYPDSVDPQIFLSRQQMFYGNKEEAWRICNAITDKEDREVLFLQAELYFYFNESNLAFNHLITKYRQMKQEDAPDFLYDSIALCKDYGFGDKALEWITYLRKDYPDYINALPLKAEIHNFRHEYQATIDLLEHNLHLVSFNVQAWLQLAEAHLWLENYDDALEATEYLLAINSENAEGLLMRANILLDMGRLQESHDYYSRFLAYFPDDEKANYLDAQCLIESGRYTLAIQRLERLMAMPDYTMQGYVMSSLAYCHAKLGHNEQSLHYRQQAERDPYNNLSELFPELYPQKPEDNDLPF